MYFYEWDKETGGYNLVTNIADTKKEIRPVFFEELQFLGFDKSFGWLFPKVKNPLCWAEGRRYFYRGELVAETLGGNLYDKPKLKNVTPNLKLNPVDLKAMIANNSDVMNGLIQRTLKDIYAVCQSYREKVNLFYAAFSGGKDSLVLLDLVQRALPHDTFDVIFCDTTMELSDTYKTVDATKKIFPDLNWHTAKTPFTALDSWNFMGPPARKIRWCCAVHKTGPSIQKVKEIIATRRNCNVADVKNFRVMSFIGVRAEESERRSTYKKIAVSQKHSAQINFYPLLEWSSAEIFLYLFAENLPFNQSYRNGLPRVGCKFCPLASEINDCLQNNFYPDEIAPFIETVKQTIDKGFETAEQWEDYLKDQGWKKRSGGKVLVFGDKKIEITNDGDFYKFVISNANYSWRKWMPILGNFVGLGDNKFSLKYENQSVIFSADTQADRETVSFRTPFIGNENIKFLSRLKKIFNKSAYCRNCGNCMIECPHNALTVISNDVAIKNCKHCYRCLEKPYGCLAADSIRSGGELDTVSVKGIDHYKTFGLRLEWIKILFENPKNFWDNQRMGSNMFLSFEHWGREIGLLSDRRTFSENFEKIKSLGAENLKLWSFFWVNLAYNSVLINFFVKHVDFYFPVNNENLIELFGDTLKERTKKNALTALKNTFRASPIGENLGQGICKLKGNVIVSIIRTTWENPEPIVILYSLYKFAEHSDNRYIFTLTDLLNDSAEREALSPKIIFGIDEKTLRRILQGLSNDYPNFIRVEFNKGFMENIFLNKDETSDAVIQLF